MPYPRVKPKETPTAFPPIARLTRFYTQNTQPPIALRIRAQLQQALKFTPSQAFQQYLSKALLALWYTHVIEITILILNA